MCSVIHCNRKTFLKSFWGNSVVKFSSQKFGDQPVDLAVNLLCILYNEYGSLSVASHVGMQINFRVAVFTV